MPHGTPKGWISMCCPSLQVGHHVSAARVLELMQGAGFAPTVQAYTSYMDACVKANTATSLARAFQVLLCNMTGTLLLSRCCCEC